MAGGQRPARCPMALPLWKSETWRCGATPWSLRRGPRARRNADCGSVGTASAGKSPARPRGDALSRGRSGRSGGEKIGRPPLETVAARGHRVWFVRQLLACQCLARRNREGAAMRVALYARVSTADKDQHPETQLRPLREHLAALGRTAEVEPAGEYVDRASADDLRGRRAWRRLLELAHRRRVDLVVVWKLDRAFRSVLDGATTLQALRAAGCGLRSLQEPWIDTTTPVGEALNHIPLAWAQLEKRQLAERVRAGMARARAEGKALGRPPRARPVTAHPQWPV